MPIHINVGGVWKEVDIPHHKVGGTWKTPDAVHINVGGVWKEVWPSSVPPTVSAVAASDSNTLQNEPGGFTACYAGLKFDYNTTEYVATGAGGYSSVGTWLDSGTPEQVWVEFLRSGGSKTQFIGKSNSTRYQITADSVWRITDTNTGGSSVNIIGRFRFWDAASGGNILQTTTASQTWTANLVLNPCPLCCFTPDTPVMMATGLQMPIGKIREGDMVAVLDLKTNEIVEQEVSEVITRTNRPMFRLYFASGRVLEASDDHPLHVKGKGAASLNHHDTEYKDLGLPKQLALGDFVADEAGRQDELIGIKPMDYPGTVFTLENSLFFANGLLVY